MGGHQRTWRYRSIPDASLPSLCEPLGLVALGQRESGTSSKEIIRTLSRVSPTASPWSIHSLLHSTTSRSVPGSAPPFGTSFSYQTHFILSSTHGEHLVTSLCFARQTSSLGAVRHTQPLMDPRDQTFMTIHSRSNIAPAQSLRG